MAACAGVIETKHVTKFMTKSESKIAAGEIAVESELPADRRIKTDLRGFDCARGAARSRDVAAQGQVRVRDAARFALGADDEIGVVHRRGGSENGRGWQLPSLYCRSESLTEIVTRQTRSLQKRVRWNNRAAVPCAGNCDRAVGHGVANGYRALCSARQPPHQLTVDPQKLVSGILLDSTRLRVRDRDAEGAKRPRSCKCCNRLNFADQRSCPCVASAHHALPRFAMRPTGLNVARVPHA